MIQGIPDTLILLYNTEEPLGRSLIRELVIYMYEELL